MSTATFPVTNTATVSLDHYERMVECGAFDPPYNLPVELIRGKIVEKGTGAPAKFTLDHYEHMVAVGAFDPPYNIPVELLQGELVMTSPIGEPHSRAVIALTEWSYEVVDRKHFIVRVQVPIRIPFMQSEPEPDLVWVLRKAQSEKPPLAEEVHLLIEVAESSLAYDRDVKLSMYAQAGISEYWIVNLIDEQVEVYRSPSGGAYRERSVYHGDETVEPLALPGAALAPSRLFA